MSKFASVVVGLVALGFALGCSQASGQGKEYAPGTDVLPGLEFEPGGTMVVTQGKTLDMSASQGYAWAIFPSTIDLNRNPRMKLSVKTTGKCAVQLELKDKNGFEENPLVGKERINNVWKVKVQLPNTGGKFQDVVVDLEPHFRPDPKERRAKVIVFSDPDGGIAVESLRFERKAE